MAGSRPASAGRSGIHISNDNIEWTVLAALRTRINAGGDRGAVEFISTRNVATVNTSMEVR